ncbi:MAG TPA: hypothetical protein VFO37_04845 [Chitinophagaceae bacterium]|nr:hypothetical protein [Chitinophagaceae bacterium]
MSVPQTNDSKFNTTHWIVSSDGLADGATHTTITAALASAVSGDTIFVKPGTYTENFTAKAGVGITAYPAQGHAGQVNIVGKILFTDAGTLGISGIRLFTNADYFFQTTGSNSQAVYFVECEFIIDDNDGINIANANAQVNCIDCFGGVTTTGVRIWNNSGGTLNFFSSNLTNDGSSTTASTNSAGTVALSYSSIRSPVSTSSTGAFNCLYSRVVAGSLNTTAATLDGSGQCQFIHSEFTAGTASAISIGASGSLLFRNGLVSSSNTNAITGAGTIAYGTVDFTDSRGMNVTTTTKQGGTNFSRISFDEGANLLEEYEEGSFTPALARTGLTFGYTTQVGRYIRIGDIVHVWCRIVLSSVSGVGSGNLTMTDLPFTSSNVSGIDYFGTAVATVTTLAGDSVWQIAGNANTTTATIYANLITSGTLNAAITPAATHSQWFNFTYRTG